MSYPLVLDLAADGFAVAVTCRVLGFSTQAFNKWRRDPVRQRDWDEAHLINAAIDIQDDDPAFGYRFISDELADAGFEVSERRVWRVCSQEGIWSVFAKKKACAERPDLRSMTIWWTATSPQTGPMPCGSPTSPSTGRMKGSFTAAPLRTSTRTASSATASRIA